MSMEPDSREAAARGEVGDIAEVLGHRMADSTPVNWLEVAVQANQAAAVALAQLERDRL